MRGILFSSRRPTHCRRPAYSLVELTIVLLVLGLLTGIAAPRWTEQLSRYRVEAAAQRVAYDLERIQSTAYLSSAERTLTFDVARQRYQILGLADPDRRRETYTVYLDQPPYRATLVMAEFGGGSAVTFDGFGLPRQGGGTVVLRAGALERTVVVDGDTGKVTIP